jgi:hypothetical protein
MKNLFVCLFLNRFIQKGRYLEIFLLPLKSNYKKCSLNYIHLKIIIKFIITFSRYILEFTNKLSRSFIYRLGILSNKPSKKHHKISIFPKVTSGLIFLSVFFLKISLSAGECIQGDCINGEGTMKFANGDSYTGTFKDEKKIGYGIYIFSNGERYEGEFQADFPNGKGTAFLGNGNVYTGYFINNVPDGKGKMVFNNGNIYDGEWKRGVREGNGTMSYVDGSIYTGEWKSNKKSGYGTFRKSIIVGIQTPSMPMQTRPLRKINESQFWITKIQN